MEERKQFKDYFSKQAAIYARFRPSYPKELFEYIASVCEEHDYAWDCATGNGQAAVALATYFKTVIATDASEEQLKLAAPHKNVEYRVALAEKSGLGDGVADLITVANAIHWFDLEKFYTEIKRVLKPGGIIAVWSYADSFVDEKVDAVMKHLAREILKDYWPEGNKMVVNGYKDLTLPFPELKHHEFKYSMQVNQEGLEGFAYSWSSTQRYIASEGKDPVALVKKELAEAWSNVNESKNMTWNLALKVAKKPK